MTAGAFHVVVERARDGGTARLADAMSAQYGLPADTLRTRLAAGPLRVKSNVDLATAESFVADLETLGAVCAILDAATGAPRVKPAAVVAPKAAPKPQQSALAGIAPTPRASQPQIASGLSAAFSPSSSAQDLGVLGGDSGEFSLATLDGNDDASDPGPELHVASSADALPASFGPPAAPGPTLAAGAVVPIDLFAPPDAQADEPQLDVGTIAKKSGQLAEPTAAKALPTLAAGAPDAPPVPRGPSGLAGVVADPRARLGAGVALAILLGFVPATLIASMRESSAYAEIDDAIQKQYRAVTSSDDWHALDAMLSRQKDHKEGQRRNIALGSMVIWALVGAGVAFVWFRKIDWDGVVQKLDR